MAEKTSRKLKIYGYHRYDQEVPQLRLIGTWMEKAGFKVGDHVNISIQEKLLIIKSDKTEGKK